MDAAADERTGSSPGVSEEALAAIGMPERLESPFGSLEFFDGLPLPDTVQRSYDALDLMRGVEVFLNCMPGASMVAMRSGLRSVGQTASNVLAYTDPLATSANVVLTANTETTYGTNYNPYPSIHSKSEGMRTENNGDLVISFGPAPPDGRDGNWIQTRADKGWFPILRIYGPLESWFDKTWRPGEIQPAD